MKLLINIRIPSVSERYDILIPNDMRIKSVVSLVASAMEKLSDHRHVASGEECLYSVEKDIPLRHNATLAQYGIQNGDHLIMV